MAKASAKITKNSRGSSREKYKEWITESGLLRIEAWSRDGLSLDQISNNMGVTRKTLAVWRKKYPEIETRFEKGREVTDICVENALYSSCFGHYVTETRKEKGETDKGFIDKEVVTTRYVKANVTAQIYWLQNRKPDDWKDRRQADIHISQDIEDLAPLAKMLGGDIKNDKN